MDEESSDVETIEDYDRAMEKFLLYFEQTWIGAKNRRTGIRERPKFAYALWNKFEALKEGMTLPIMFLSLGTRLANFVFRGIHLSGPFWKRLRGKKALPGAKSHSIPLSRAQTSIRDA